ncbi:histidine phosphatase family protein [Pseudonocardia acaciae]|uniref:histidine phosphatase family protein n=1 Tax=Pseudonocardia acaciae TaxID=551276 RepID=UPI0006859102|nr:histidine phosphatase family protein [Pseudonocardia acaciae]
MRLILVRHALPHRGEAGDGNGVADPGLTELGRRQADRVAEALAGQPVAAIYTSPQRRARETAAPLAGALGMAVTVAEGLAEYDAGDRHYIPVHQMAEADPAAWARMLAGQLPEHVDVEAFRARVDGALGGIADAHPGAATAVCFAHAGTINVYLAALLGLARPLTFPLDYTGITRVTVSRAGRRSVRTINEIAHVADLLDPTTPALPGVPGK